MKPLGESTDRIASSYSVSCASPRRFSELSVRLGLVSIGYVGSTGSTGSTGYVGGCIPANRMATYSSVKSVALYAPWTSAGTTRFSVYS